MTEKKSILVFLGCIFLVYLNSLFNGFIGDTRFLFVDNAFYSTLAHLPRIFSPDFVMTPARLDPALSLQGTDLSGFISYRPVTAVTFFLDRAVWGDLAFGYHLSNLLLHLTACWLVWRVALTLTEKKNVAFWAALLFGAHPVQAEVVNNPGYRSDILVTVLVLSAFLLYVRFTRAGGWRPLALSLAAVALAMFTKESAVVWPVLALVYHRIYVSGKGGGRPAQIAAVLYTAVAVLFVWVYFFLRPGVFYPKFFGMYPDAGIHFIVCLKILFEYLTALVWPFEVKVLPPLFAPPTEAIASWQVLIALGAFVASVLWAIRSFERHRAAAFLVLWFWLTYLPSSHLLPLLNPYAYRFLYLPSVGFCILAAWGLERFAAWVDVQAKPRRSGLFFRWLIVGLAAGLTFSLNPFYASDVVACREMVRNFPTSSRPYWILGNHYLERQQYTLAGEHLIRYLENDPQNPFGIDPLRDFSLYQTIGRCFIDEPDRAIAYFKRAEQLRPDVAVVQVDLAKAHLQKNDPFLSLFHARRALALSPDIPMAYVYAAHSAWVLGNADEARGSLAAGLARFPDDPNLAFLQNVFQKGEGL